MVKRIILPLMLCVLFMACESAEEGLPVFEVSFDLNGGESKIEGQQLEAGEYVLKPADPNRYAYLFEGWYKGDVVYDFNAPVEESFTLRAEWTKVEVDGTPWISEVLDFRPAPGQFLNKVEDDLAAAKENLVGNSHQFISLGTFGGQVTFKFDHPINNGEGEDLAIFGNAFEGNSEPGIVMVCQDLNGNGYPDEEEPWFELAGSDHFEKETIRDYLVTYFRPEEGADTHLIPYTEVVNGQENSGMMDFTLVRDFHPQPMFPDMYSEDSVTFSGTLLKSKTYNQNEGQSDNPYYVSPKFDWGYADNAGYEQEGIFRGADLFDIDHAIDSQGRSVKLEQIDFVRVYTGVRDIAGWLGELSPEIIKAADVHLLKNLE
ncbi:InlB B-repeat-containing protein [Persicobacter diffluens]|uniref:Bacterial repeat domain-containing protein n=1 Tax=Persicobacter diffluens TaxID=981 RepID=A0AAN5AP96_9BACT|nr:hypothetical protein PEDI_41500 [Persicobacter diffluens]